MKCIKNQYLTEDKRNQYMDGFGDFETCEFCNANFKDLKDTHIKYYNFYNLILCDSCAENKNLWSSECLKALGFPIQRR